MPIQTKIRYKPDQFRSALEALIVGGDPAAATGTVVLGVQAIQYDDTKIVDINAIEAGDVDQEKFITIIYEDQLQFDIQTLAVMDNTTRNTTLRNALDGWATVHKPRIQAVAPIIRSARKMNARNLP